VVAAIAVVVKQQPKLFSVIYGEGITNDAVGIILFNTVVSYAGPGAHFTYAFEDCRKLYLSMYSICTSRGTHWFPQFSIIQENTHSLRYYRMRSHVQLRLSLST
jgi:sodium/hydrogen exchanger-like protein 6/7